MYNELLNLNSLKVQRGLLSTLPFCYENIISHKPAKLSYPTNKPKLFST